MKKSCYEVALPRRIYLREMNSNIIMDQKYKFNIISDKKKKTGRI